MHNHGSETIDYLNIYSISHSFYSIHLVDTFNNHMHFQFIRFEMTTVICVSDKAASECFIY